MNQAAVRERWQRQSHLMALMANCHRDPNRRRRPFTAAEFDAFALRHRPQPKREQMLRAKPGGSWGTFKAACAGAGWIR